jgi:DNA polymerase I-like protein with 3'-5' exonuclease and polymerase domains
VDVETDSPDPRRARLTHLAWATATGSGALYRPGPEALAALARAGSATTLVFHNAIYDLVVLARAGCDLLGCAIDDTRVMSVLLDESGSHALASLARRYLRATDVLRLREVLRGADPAHAAHLLGLKARVDCERTLQLYEALSARLAQYAPVGRAYADVERPLVAVLARMTLLGLPVDRAALRRAMEAALVDRPARPALRRLLRWDRELDSTGRFHPNYSAWSDPTGAVQMQGARADGNPSLLRFLAPPEGRALLQVTFPQLALRWMATLAACGPLLEAFRIGAPTGQHVAAFLPGALPASVIEAWLLALAAGRGPRTVMRATGLSLREAKAARARLVERLPALGRWLADMEEVGARRGWLQAPSGRRRRFTPRYTARQAAADLVAMCCHDTAKRVLVRLSRTLPAGALVGAHRNVIYLEVDSSELDQARTHCDEAVREAARGLACPAAIDVKPVGGG